MTNSGTIRQIVFESRALRGNRLDDPHIRPLYIYLPPGYDDTDARYPVLYLHDGQWDGKQIVSSEWIHPAAGAPVTGTLPSVAPASLACSMSKGTGSLSWSKLRTISPKTLGVSAKGPEG